MDSNPFQWKQNVKDRFQLLHNTLAKDAYIFIIKKLQRHNSAEIGSFAGSMLKNVWLAD